MNYADIRQQITEQLTNVEPELREQYLHFIETGEADVKFWDAMEGNDYIRTAINLMYDAQTRAFEELSAAIRADLAK